MRTFHRVVLGFFVASMAASLLASVVFGSRAALWCGMPALLISAWAALGHLVTLDDEATGGWSSPGSSSQVWFQSLGELAVKILIALFVAWLVVSAPLAHHAV